MGSISAIASNISSVLENPAGLFSDSGHGEAFSQALDQALGRDGDREALGGILNKNKLTLKNGREAGQGFMKGFSGAGPLSEALDLARAGLPATFRKQVGLGLMALGRSGSSANSMLAGARLMDCRSSGEALKGLFSSLGAERSFLKLDKEALPAFGQILSDSGVSDSDISSLMSWLGGGQLTLDRLYQGLEKLDLSGARQGGLTATEDGLAALGQFFGSLGASAEIVEAVTSGFTPGQPVSASALRQIISSGNDGLLAPSLSEADARDLASMLESMGVGQKRLESLSTLLRESGGQMSVDSFLNFIEGLEQAPAKPLTGQDMDLVKTVLDNLTKERELVKTPVFDETLIRLQALGDQDIDEDFINLSPALQALRGGLSGAAQNAAFGGHNGRRDREEQPRNQNAAANNGEASAAKVQESLETVQSYGGQESLARQISRKIIYSQRRGVHRLKMKLNPDDLGQLDIELKVKGDQLTAHIRAKNRAAYEALSGEIEELKSALAESGVEIRHLTLAFDDEAGGQTEYADLNELQARTARVQAREEARGRRQADARQGEISRMI
ncbi:MAG: flagellar hook-length control protein FliK [Candidatus Adiutrix sp.]|nr:flagellar hook-length control protein FliK [Candidatus Adiutrix sp.]